jgi:hypothetical protein
MFGKRVVPPAPSAQVNTAATAAAVNASFVQQPISYERLLQSIKEDAHFYDQAVNPRALMTALDNDPYLLQKEQASRLNRQLLKLMSNRPNPRIETHLGILGSVAGWVCLLEAFEMYKRGARLHDGVFGGLKGVSFGSVKGSDGNSYFFGNLIDDLLLARDTSIWKLTGGMALLYNPARMPEMGELWDHLKTTFQSSSYGTLRHPFDKSIDGKPIDFVRQYWSQLSGSFLAITTERFEIHQVFAFAIQESIHKRPDGVDAGYLAAAVMECAMPMAHIHPEAVIGGIVHKDWGTIQ